MPTAATPVAAEARGGGSAASLPTRIGDWLVERLGKAAMPVAIGTGAVAGGALGMVTLGPVGAIGGAVAGGWLGMLVVGLRP